jgi:hypothetical protein
MSAETRPTSNLLVVAAWVFVAIPLSWGLYQSIIKSKPLFSGARAPAQAPAK